MPLKIRVHERTHGSNKRIQESDMLEMACLRKKRTGLPVNIYVDDSGQWKESGHANRIKFQNNKGNLPVTRGMIPMSIDEDPVVLVDNPRMELSQADVNAVKKFVTVNKDLLNRLGDDLDIDDFIKTMVVENNS